MNSKKMKYSIGRLAITLFVLVTVIVGGTYAWLSYQSNKSALVLSIGDINDSKVILKPYQVKETMAPVNTYTNGVYSTVEAINNGDSSISLKLFYKVNQLDDSLKNNGLKYTIVSSTSENGTYTEVKTGDFKSIDNNETSILETKMDSNSTTYYRVYLWLDSRAGDQTALQNMQLDVELNGEMQQEATAPEVMDGMIPVVIENDGTATTISKDSKDWYDYRNQKWANAILVTSGSRSKYLNKSGVPVTDADILAYYVWIPRYKYKIWETGTSAKGKEQTIDIVFENKDIPKSTGTTVGTYRTHPAFTFGNVELNGIWVGKFETTGDASTPTILPNLQSLRNQSVSTEFITSLKFSGGILSNGNVTFAGNNTYGLTVNTNAHMAKNSEWGAVAYLSHSKYGVNREVYINNSNSMYTGRSGGNVGGSTAINSVYTDQTSTKLYNDYGFYTWDGYLLEYNTNTKSETHDITKVASTTGNITGVYDMSGGTWEYVMGNYNKGLGDSGFMTYPSNKYYDLYTTTTSTTACDGGICYGHALSETAKWYGDYPYLASSGGPWFVRGGDYGSGVSVGTFNSGGDRGASDNFSSWRSVLVPVETYTISYNANGGSAVPASQIKQQGEDLILSSTKPTRTGYTFLGWSTSSTATSATYAAGASYMKDADTTLYAVWRANTYTIGYTLNGGTKGSSAPASGTYNADVYISNPTKTVTVSGNANGTGASFGSATSKTQTFAGWTATGLGSNAKTGTTANPSAAWTGSSTKNTYFRNLRNTTGTVTFTAAWTPVAFNLPYVSKSGYTCSWNTASNGSGESYSSGASYIPSATSVASITMYARCTANTYTIKYDANGGSGQPGNQTKTHGVPLILSSVKPTRTGYTFLGWSTSSTATSATYQAGGSYTANVGATLYAVWKLNTSYSEPILNGAAPQLDSEGMIPVTISDTGVASTVAMDSSNWYSYENKKWANAILVKSDVRSQYLGTEGKEVNPDDILAYYVWIPRYKYKIWETGRSSIGKEQTIEIVFENKSTSKSTGTAVGSYRTHPAFTFGSTELNGIWVGKFETSGDAANPTILPNKVSLTNQNVSTQFITSLKFSGGTLSNGNVTYSGSNTYGLSATANSHMAKNSEWGAIAYLSHSKYGINGDIMVNNNQDFITGCGAHMVDANVSSRVCEIAYGEANSYPQSTTGNSTGVFDMAGGVTEYVMGVVADSNGNPRSGVAEEPNNSGFNGTVLDETTDTDVQKTSGIDFPPTAYYDLYTDTEEDNTTACNGGVCFGHALSETDYWYDDYDYFVWVAQPWMMRNGIEEDWFPYVGIFSVRVSWGAAESYITFRSILIPGIGA